MPTIICCVCVLIKFVFLYLCIKHLIFDILEPTICRAKTWGAQFAAPIFSRGPICPQKNSGAQFAGKKFAEAQFATKKFQGPNLLQHKFSRAQSAGAGNYATFSKPVLSISSSWTGQSFNLIIFMVVLIVERIFKNIGLNLIIST